MHGVNAGPDRRVSVPSPKCTYARLGYGQAILLLSSSALALLKSGTGPMTASEHHIDPLLSSSKRIKIEMIVSFPLLFFLEGTRSRLGRKIKDPCHGYDGGISPMVFSRSTIEAGRG